jgi:hypothetical protein
MMVGVFYWRCCDAKLCYWGCLLSQLLFRFLDFLKACCEGIDCRSLSEFWDGMLSTHIMFHVFPFRELISRNG